MYVVHVHNSSSSIHGSIDGRFLLNRKSDLHIWEARIQGFGLVGIEKEVNARWWFVQAAAGETGREGSMAVVGGIQIYTSVGKYKYPGCPMSKSISKLR